MLGIIIIADNDDQGQDNEYMVGSSRNAPPQI